MNAPTFKPATRQTVRPLIGLFGKSGGGKTMTALLLARGIVGPQGRIALIDTENGRGSYFADLIPGGYSVLQLDPPFSPQAYGNALSGIEQFDIGVIDSMTHEWNGEGGYLDIKEQALTRMAGDDWRKREKCAMAAAAQCKPQHNRLVQQMLRLKVPLILCFRGKDKVKMEKAADGKTAIVAEDHATPIQESGLIFEMLIAGEVYARDEQPDVGGFFRPTKITHPDLRQHMPKPGEQLGIAHGQAIAKWASNPGGSPAAQPASFMAERKGATPEQLRARILAIAKDRFADDERGFEQMLWDEGIITEHESFAELTAERLLAVGPAVKAKLGGSK